MLSRSLAALALLSLAGCFPISAPFHLYPISAAPPQPPVLCRFKIHFGWQSATITATLPGGDLYSGSFALHTAIPDRELAPYWDQVFGSGYFNAKVLGSPRHFRTVLKNDQGAELVLEMHQIPGDNHGGMEGVAIDSHKGIYKAGY
ncbi:hypothetical protein GETHPA_09340 [Geothrix rubra]|uniref:Lipoprotein n=1 Tax=Geothrix rubra TaxID=2927977 RepID=A0ABQ5Q511_9BACT|nr:hypothetical protein [Geothrix rubra]GLH69401.1 hypothetical protein GETHPA_09340 [Geothrix rubra]